MSDAPSFLQQRLSEMSDEALQGELDRREREEGYVPPKKKRAASARRRSPKRKDAKR